MGSNESISPKQFLSKIEEGQAKLYYDIGKRVHSYFEETFKEMQQYLKQITPQHDDSMIEESEKYEQLLNNYGLLQQEFQKLKQSNDNQKSKIQKLKENNDRLSMKVEKPSSKKAAENNETEPSNHTDQPKTTTKKPREPKNTKIVKTLTVTDATNKDQPDIWDYEGMDLLNEQYQNESDEKMVLDE
ncbi:MULTISPECIES: hypothetical protein [Paenibacillus]|jgi:predicted nuclease with TOPRIM domain|uniref:hypothetical protein n=1 Tax=Paenibacillus TaxID=44249 RepID=UPI002DBEE451|nr:hypothetical protein [Paenibacillus odorifer]MEC0129508.1 hypothetical protein [Paenibacillus odorifer]MEC0221127.1 hypothetical protein [Paenibacillus odorifer]